MLEGLRGGRTFDLGAAARQAGARLFLEADSDGDGTFESIVGDTVPAGLPAAGTSRGCARAELRVITNGGRHGVPARAVTGTSFEHRFRVGEGTWVRAEVAFPDLAEQRRALCGDAHDLLPEPPARGGDDLGAVLSRTAVAPEVTVDVDTGDRHRHAGQRLVARTWSLAPFRTERLIDLRTGPVWSEGSTDFRLLLDGPSSPATR